MAAPNREAMLKLRAEWKRDGICTRCGKWPPTTGTRCDECKQVDSAYRAAGKRKNMIATQQASVHPERVAS